MARFQRFLRCCLNKLDNHLQRFWLRQNDDFRELSQNDDVGLVGGPVRRPFAPPGRAQPAH
jgi:hypothetical protein